jgi:hypothetical protein
MTQEGLMKKLSFVALLLVAATVLGATVLREPVAEAASAVLQVNIVGPLDGGGNVKVHEQGTANVNVTNANLSVAPRPPVTDGGNQLTIGCPGNEQFVATVSALSIHMSAEVQSLVLFGADGVAARFPGPAAGGNASIVLALDRPISFTSVTCGGVSGTTSIGTVGNSP